MHAFQAQVRSLPCLLCPALGIILGTVCSKVLFVLIKAQEQLDNYGLAAFLRTQPAEFTFVGGCIGLELAVCLAARLCKQPVSSTLDAFAPAGALMAAVVRGSTYFLDRMSMVGVGDYVENEALCFFPVAVENEMLFGWFYAVFMLDNKYLFGLELAPDTCYILMIVLLMIIGGLEMWAFRRLNRSNA